MLLLTSASLMSIRGHHADFSRQQGQQSSVQRIARFFLGNGEHGALNHAPQ